MTKGSNPEFEWYVRKIGEEEYTLIDGNNTGTLTIPSAGDAYDDARCYCNVIFGDITIRSSEFVLYSNATLKTKLPEEISFCPGHEIRLTAQAVNQSEIYYSWYISPDRSYNGDVISYEPELVYSIDSAYDGGYIYCRMEKENGNVTRTSFIKLTLSHTAKTVTKKATLTANGSINTVCSACGELLSGETIYMPKTFKLAASSYTYSGKAVKPGVTVTDSKGRKLVSGTDYSVSYSNNTNPGKATVKVTGKGKYSFTKSLSFTISPKGTSIKSLSAISKGFKIKWTKQAVKTSGYEIRYSTAKKMSGAKTLRNCTKTS